MTREEFVTEFAAILSIPAVELSPATNLKALKRWDSVAALNVLVLVDENFGVPLRPDVLARAQTFADILAIVESKFS